MTFLRLFADFERSNPLIPSIYKDIDHLAQRINDPLAYNSRANDESHCFTHYLPMDTF